MNTAGSPLIRQPATSWQFWARCMGRPTDRRPLGTIVSREKESHGLVVANLGHGDPDRTKAAIGLAAHGDARAMSVAGLDRDAASVPQIARSREVVRGHALARRHGRCV